MGIIVLVGSKTEITLKSKITQKSKITLRLEITQKSGTILMPMKETQTTTPFPTLISLNTFNNYLVGGIDKKEWASKKTLSGTKSNKHLKTARPTPKELNQINLKTNLLTVDPENLIEERREARMAESQIAISKKPRLMVWKTRAILRKTRAILRKTRAILRKTRVMRLCR